MECVRAVHLAPDVKSSPLLPLHRAAGARLTAPDQGSRLLTYGDVPAEYAAAMEGCALFDATERGLVSVMGADADTFLHRLLASDVRGLAPGHGSQSLLLTGKGKIVHDFELAPVEGGFHLSTPPGAAPDLVAKLDTYLFAEAVELADRSESSAPLELCGPEAAARIEAVLGAAPPVEFHQPAGVTFAGHPCTVVALPVAGSPGWRLDPGPERSEELFRALCDAGATPAGVVVRETLRIEAGRALWGADVDENVYPQEARLTDAFSLDKGCYIGQEVVAKIDTYGGLNKCLFALAVNHDDPVSAGTRLMFDDEGEWRDLGVVTSWAYSFVLDTGLVLAYVKRRHQAVDTKFRLGDGPGTATIVPLPVRANAVPI